MGKKTPPCDRYPEWTEARLRSFVRSNIRRMQRLWPPMQEIWKERRDKPKDTPGRHKYEYQCEGCSEWFPRDQMHADHIVPCGSIIDIAKDAGPFIDRMLAPVEGFTRLCKSCHQEKTNQERKDKNGL